MNFEWFSPFPSPEQVYLQSVVWKEGRHKRGKPIHKSDSLRSPGYPPKLEISTQKGNKVRHNQNGIDQPQIFTHIDLMIEAFKAEIS